MFARHRRSRRPGRPCRETSQGSDSSVLPIRRRISSTRRRLGLERDGRRRAKRSVDLANRRGVVLGSEADDRAILNVPMGRDLSIRQSTHGAELVEEIQAVMRAGRGFGVILHAEDRQAFVPQALRASGRSG